MIDKGNDRVNRVIYDGYVINKMYGCDGELVYNRSNEKYGCDTLYLEDYSGGTYTVECMRDNCDFLSGHGVKNLIYRHDGIEETVTFLNYVQERSITSITIGDCVTTLENSVFANWSGVTEVTLSPYLVAIYGGGTYGTFYNCKSLRSITFPQHFRSMYNAFENCSSLSSVTFNDELKYLGANSFYGCTSLTNVELPNSVVELGMAAFNGCTSLSSVTLSSGLTVIEEHTFEGCSSLTDLEIPSSVLAIRGAAFNGCSSLSALTLNEGLESIDNCISGCFALKSVVFPSTFTTFETGSMVFSNTGVESVTFLNPTPPIVGGSGDIGFIFTDASQLTNIYVPCDALTTYKNAWASVGTWLTNKLHPIQGSCPYPTYDFVVEYKYDYQGQSIDYVRRASDCPSLDPDASTLLESETRIFAGCYTVTNFNKLIENVTVGDDVNLISNNCFKGWSALTEATISMDVNAIYGGAFQDCPNLKRVNLYAITPPSLYSNRTPFSGSTNCLIYVPCDALEAYRNSSDWSYLRTRIRPMDEFCPVEGKFRLTLNDLTTVTAACDASSAVTSGEVMAHYSDSLVSATIGECATSIGDRTFYNCEKLSDVVIGDNVTSIGAGAFLGCVSLTSCTIGSGITTIGSGAFWKCTKLKTLTIPSGVTAIDDYAFYDCSGLTSMIIEADTPPSAYPYSFYHTSNCIYYVPSQSVDLYKHTVGWSSVASRIQAIPS